ncbi:DNA/RNA endonuclease YhcR with UshA esterase domain [Salibacterium salarium]|uniref:endonuclease n=1 Tax=Salibacterium salarium TaxID=284579 RepID=UPI00277FF9DB|nr:endonuclease [Salibacterium salarium]MDQ0298139.1 DNA/RNA endonuclease YhcR with UshA esterase domain [Salibacterium salarium]
MKIGAKKVVALLLGVGIIGVPGFIQAEGPDDPAPEIIPDDSNGKSVLFDNTHAQTAGQADWVIDGAFSDFAEGIADNGYHVNELRQTTPIDVDDLEPYDVFVIPEANIPFKKEEQEAMIEYTENGGSIFFISDHYNADRNLNRWDSSEIMNGYRRGAYDDPVKGMDQDEIDSEAMQNVESSDWLSDNFGIRFRFNAPGTVTADQIVDPAHSFGITEGVNEVAMHAGSTLAITDPDVAKGIVYLPDNLDQSDKWDPAVDEGIYHGGGEDEGPYAAIAKHKDGKAAFIGDSSPVEDATPKYRNEQSGQTKTTYDGFQEADDAELLLNMIDWLAEEEEYDSFSETDIPLDDTSPLLNKEIPENTSQPEPEPWSQPSTGYDWYDPSTFADGSYGSSEDPVENPTFKFNHQDTLPNDGSFTLELVIDGLNPNQTISSYNIGMYLEGGQQVAQVQNDDGSWPSQYGYSEDFSVTADEDGTAVKELTVRVQEGTQGEANLRLRQGGSNLYTTSVSIGEGTGDPEAPDDGEREPEFMSIQEARTQTEGTEVEVEGVITSTPGMFGAQGFYIQDESAGIYIFQDDNSIQKGDKVRITGSLDTYNSEKELVNIKSIEIQRTSNLPPYKTVEFLDGENQGERVTITGGTIENMESFYNAFEFDIRKNSQTTKVRVDHRTNISLEDFNSSFNEGDSVSVSGIASIYQGNHQLMLLDLEDVELNTSPPVIQDISMSEFEITKKYDVPLIVKDEDSDVTTITAEMNGETWDETINISPLQFKPGTYAVTVRAKDEAGHTTERSFEIEGVLGINQLDELVELGEENGYIHDEKVVDRLVKKAENVQKAKNEPSRSGKWNALLHQLEAQSGKKVEEEYLSYWTYPKKLTEN